MGVAFVAAKFVDTLENGCEAKKIAFVRAQGEKIAEKRVANPDWDPVDDPDGANRWKRKKDDVYLVDCAITGSSPGTPADPKCALSALFEKYVFPWVDEAVAPGGWAEGHTVIFQGDQAGPHEDGEFRRIIAEAISARNNYHWEPQAPQMPHANVLDLAVFPCMSKKHTELARERNGLKVLSGDETWGAADNVWWYHLPESKIASSFVLMQRLMRKVIKEKGGNSFVGSDGEISCCVRGDFVDTETGGVRRRDEKRIPPPDGN
jgi:hypothetical protein